MFKLKKEEASTTLVSLEVKSPYPDKVAEK